MSSYKMIVNLERDEVMRKTYCIIFTDWFEKSKRIWLTTLMLFTLSNYIFPQNNFSKHIVDGEKAYFKKIKEFKANKLTDNYDIIYHRAEWEAYPDQYYIKGAITSYFKSKVNGMNTVVFDLSSELQIDSVLQMGEKSTFTFQNNIVTINLSKTLNYGNIDSVTIFYQGAPIDDGFGSFIASQHGEGSPVLWTLSEPYGARDWWPCKQSLTDKIDSMDIYVVSDFNYRVGSNGKLMSETISDTKKTTHWQTKYPIATYLVAIAITDYAVQRDTALVDENHIVEVLNYAYPESLNDAITTSDYTVRNIELFSNLFIPYPFYKEKYGHAQFGWGGGMEHQTMTFLCCFDQGLITHELAHQWFGDYVTCGSWKDIWINEGFATFCEGLTMEHFNPGSEVNWRAGERNYIISETGGSVIVDDTASIMRIFSGRLSYAKGGMVIGMLRSELGDEAFFNGCKMLLNESAKIGGFATTQQAKEYFETAADTNLTGFFQNWLYGQGYPVYNIVWDQEDNGKVTIKINQTTSHPSVSFFPMHIEFKYVTDVDEVTIRLHNTENGQLFIFDSLPKIYGLNFDPENKLIAKYTISNGNVDIRGNSVEDVIFHPNPVNQKMTVESKPNLPLGKIEVFDTNGRKILDLNGRQELKTDIDFSSLKSGSYIMSVQAGNQTIIHKFTVSH